MTKELLPISSARTAGQRLGLRSMIVLQELPDGRWGYTSWGKTKADCGRARIIAELEAEVARRWQPIETAPRISRQEVLMWDGERMFVAWWNSGTFWRIDHLPFDATHWMPLPEPPNDA